MGPHSRTSMAVCHHPEPAMPSQIFVNLPVTDPTRATAVLNALACASRDEVAAFVTRALAAGGTAPNPAKDLGFMFQHGFADLDGHQWEVFHMDMSAVPPQM